LSVPLGIASGYIEAVIHIIIVKHPTLAKFLIEPLTGLPHDRKISQLFQHGQKVKQVQLLKTILRDVGCATGSNLRTILLMVGKNRIKVLDVCEIDIKYHEVLESEAWRVDFIKEVVEVKYCDLDIPGITAEKFEEIKDFLCIQ
jgi:hypothetical protein